MGTFIGGAVLIGGNFLGENFLGTIFHGAILWGAIFTEPSTHITSANTFSLFRVSAKNIFTTYPRKYQSIRWTSIVVRCCKLSEFCLFLFLHSF